jgi:hypothetical protein
LERPTEKDKRVDCRERATHVQESVYGRRERNGEGHALLGKNS